MGRTAAALLEAQLVSAGYEVTVCNAPERALEMIAGLQPAAVTIDIIMKPINGWELLTILKADPRTAHIPAIVVSIVDEPPIGALLGADEYIVKPVERGVTSSTMPSTAASSAPARRTGIRFLWWKTMVPLVNLLPSH